MLTITIFPPLQVAEWATRAFFMYGGEPHYSYQQIGDVPMSPVENLSRPSNPVSPGNFYLLIFMKFFCIYIIVNSFHIIIRKQ